MYIFFFCDSSIVVAYLLNQIIGLPGTIASNQVNDPRNEFFYFFKNIIIA